MVKRLYGVVLPENLNLQGAWNLSSAYSAIPKKNVTFAQSPEKARINALYRGFASQGNTSMYKLIMAKLKTQGRGIDAEVYPLSGRDFEQPQETRDTWQEMDLAVEMAESRGTSPEECYSDARTLMDLSRE
ncbi:MAG: hypothetical protein ACOCUU_01140 [Nanoarchaeota archaeon]